VSGGPEIAGERRASTEVEASFRPLDVIACDTCGRSFATQDGPGMLAVIKGPCPDCGGRFQLTEIAPDSPLL
jgi:hypothetical protein